MTDADEPTIGLRVPSELAELPPAAMPPSVGQQLQRARLAAGLSLEALSARLKVSVPRLQAFENDQLEQGANLPTSRAMVASVARTLGLDAQALLAQLPQPKAQTPAPGMQESVGGLSKESRLRVRHQGRAPIAPVWWLTAAMLVLAGLLYFYPQVAQSPHRNPGQAASEVATPAVPASVVAQGAAQSSSAPGAALAQAASSVAEVAPVPVAPDRITSAAKPTSPVLVFKARGSTWIEVTDAKGGVLLRRTLASAESAEVGGDLPLTVVIGRADHTEVLLRGAVFPLETHTQDNVARFKVP